MRKQNKFRSFLDSNQVSFILAKLKYSLKWVVYSFPVGILCGSASAILLKMLNWATDYRESHLSIISLLPIAGLLIGLLYHYWGKGSERGNNYILDEVHKPQSTIPFRMAPLVLISTVLTHLFGGSAGREGTAVQMGSAISEKIGQLFAVRLEDREIFLIIGMSAGFASVFGTPLAGTVFAIEVLIIGHLRFSVILPSLFAAYIAHFTCHQVWNVAHSSYMIGILPELSALNILYVLLAGVLFGLAALLFSSMARFWSKLSKRWIDYPPFRPLLGGIILVILIYIMGTTKYIGLGVPTILSSFIEQEPWFSFLIKIILTTFTLGWGFKGGEVTPLFFVGATLGSTLSGIIPLPIGLLAAIGFVAVFSGATNTPIACTVMGIELFGINAGIYLAIACLTAYFCAGNKGIYGSQKLIRSKYHLFRHFAKNQKNQTSNERTFFKTVRRISK